MSKTERLANWSLLDTLDKEVSIMERLRIFYEKHYGFFNEYEDAINAYLSLFDSPDEYTLEFMLDKYNAMIVIVERI